MSLATLARGHFGPGHNLNKLGRGSLGDATYQNIKTPSLMVSDKKFFHVFPYVDLCKTCDSGAGHF